MDNRSPQRTTLSQAKRAALTQKQEVIQGYIKRAETLVHRKDYRRAIFELREALKTYPNSAKCHSYLANLYYQSAQSKMAEIHAKRALSLEPNNKDGAEILQRLKNKKLSQQKSKPTPAAKKETRLFGFLSKKIS